MARQATFQKAINEALENVQGHAPLVGLLPETLEPQNWLDHRLAQVERREQHGLLVHRKELAVANALGVQLRAQAVRIVLITVLQTGVVLLCNVIC